VVYDFNIESNRGTRAASQGPVGDTVVSVESLLGQVFGSNDQVGFAAFSKMENFYFTGLSNLCTRRYTASNKQSGRLGMVGLFEYRGANPGVIQIFSDGSYSVFRNNFGGETRGPAGFIRFSNSNAQSCSFALYGSSVFLATGQGLYEFAFRSGANVVVRDVTAWVGEYAVRITGGVNIATIQIGDVLNCTPPIGIRQGPSILYVRGIRKPADSLGQIELWVTGSELLNVKENSTVAVVGKATVSGRLFQSGLANTFTDALALRPAEEQTYGLPVCCANWFSQLMIATERNYLGGSFPGVPENWNLALQDGAFFAPILARTSTSPTQLFPTQEGLFVGMVNRADTADGQLFLYTNVQGPDFFEVLNDVGPLPNTMVSLIDKIYFLSGTGVHSATVTNVRAQIGAKTVSGSLGNFFERDKPRSYVQTWGVFDKLTGQIWFGFENGSGRVFLNMDALPDLERRGESNRYSFYTGLPIALAAASQDTPLLYWPNGTGNIVQLDTAGTQDNYEPNKYLRVVGKIVTGPFRFGGPGNTSLCKDVNLVADGFQQNKIRISMLVDTMSEEFPLGPVELQGSVPKQTVYVDDVFTQGLYQGQQTKLFTSDPYHEHRGQRFRMLIEETGFNVPWEMVELSARGLSGGYKRNY
jgi:hypothetical protein